MDEVILSHYLEDFLSNDREFYNYIDFFVEIFDVEGLLRECGDTRRSGHASIEIYKYLLGLTFEDISYNRDLKKEDAPFSTSSVRRFLKNPKIDWEMFTTKLAARVFEFLYPKYENPKAKLYFILDDTPYKREYTYFGDDISIQKDHADNSYYSGYRLSALSVYYNGLILPINGVLVSSENLEKLTYKREERTESEIVRRRQRLMRSKLTDVIQEQLNWASQVGFKAKACIFDTWYTHPKTVERIVNRDLDVIGAIKNAKTRYYYQGEWLRVGEIFDKLIQLNPKSDQDDIFFAPKVIARVENRQFPMRFIYAENVNENRPYFCIACTDLTLKPADVLNIYRFRWSLETIFKELKKKTLALTGHDQSLTAEALAANIAIVFSRYLLLISARAIDGEDERSIQDQFYVCRAANKAVSEINVIIKIIQELIPDLSQQFDLNEDQVTQFMAKYLEKSEQFQDLLSKIPKMNFDNDLNKNE